MTGYTVHTGSNDKFRSGWENVFGKKSKQKSQGNKEAAAKDHKKKSKRK